MENIVDRAEILEKLKALGVKISIDDFGTGFSPLGRLKELSFDTLKIDKSFMAGIDTKKVFALTTQNYSFCFISIQTKVPLSGLLSISYLK